MNSHDFGEARVSSSYWSLSGRITSQVIQVAGFVVLSRFLAPELFGILASALIFTGFAQIFTDLGIGPAVVARRRLTQSYLSTAFWLNTLSSVILVVLLVFVAARLAIWLGYPSLRWMIPVSGLSLVFAFSPVGMAMMERQFRFRALAVFEVLGACAGQLVAIVLAINGYGLLGIALAQPLSALVLSICVSAACGWRPSLSLTKSDSRELWAYINPLISANCLNYWARSLDNLLVLKFFGADALAFYGRAYQLMLAPVMQATLALGRYYEAAFSSDARSRRRLEVRYRFTEAEVAFFGLTVSAVLAPNSEDIVRFVFGAEWESMGRLLAVLSLCIGPQVVTSANGALLRAIGETGLLFRLGLVNSVSLVIGYTIGAFIAVEAVAWAVVLHSLVATPVTMYPVCKRLSFNGRQIVGALARAAAFPAVVATGCVFIRYLSSSNLESALALQVSYVIMCAPVGVVVLRRLHRKFADELRLVDLPSKSELE